MANPETLRRLRWHAGLDEAAFDGPAVCDSTGRGSAVDEAVAAFLEVLEVLNHETNGATPSEIVGGDVAEVPRDAAYAVAEVTRMLREARHDEAACRVDAAWLGVLAGDVDDVVSYVEYERRARRATLSLIEFPADDPERARRFWTQLLGIELEAREAGEGEGWQTHSDAPAIGVHARGRGPGDSFALPYFAVGDVAEAVGRVEALGGSVVHPREAWAICRDSEGSPFGLARTSSAP